MTRICLVMIVGNESAIIERCLTAALPFIDTWCISHNGTDDTAKRIEQFFAEHPLPGRLVPGTFSDFAQARNDSLQAARSVPGWDYALLIDADMMLTGAIDKKSLRAPAYKIFQHDGVKDWSNTRLVRRDAPAVYLGVTHEYLSVEGVEDLPGLDINDVNDGGSKSDKAARDIRLLTEGLNSEPHNARYMFYLAQTYRETDRPHRAIPWYRKRIESGGWDEEIWMSYYGIALSYKELGDEANFVKTCFEAYNYRPARGEPLKAIAQYYREKSNNEIALVFADALATLKQPGDYLFVDRTVYDSGARQELAIAGYYAKSPERRKAAYEACMDLTIHANGAIRDEARRNATFYAKSAREMFGAQTRQIEWKPSNGWAPMNPSVCIGENGERLVLVRTVNYTVTSTGQYPTIDDSGIIRTRNYVLEMDQDWRPMSSAQIKDSPELNLQRSKFPVEGYEDCRLWRGGSSYFLSTTIRDLIDNTDGQCEIAVAGLDEQWRVASVRPIRDYHHDRTQKNWMPIVGQSNRFLYLCDPTIVVDASESGTTEVSAHQPLECLKDFRGGSQVIPFEDGWLCITHEVAWRPERVYLHRFVRLDAEFRVTVVSDPFYFEKVGIEFCAGLARDGDRLVASFGVNDAAAYLAFFDADSVIRELKTP